MSLKPLNVSTTASNLIIRALILILVGLLVGLMINFFSPVATLTMGNEERVLFWVSLCLVGGAGIFVCDLALILFNVKWSVWAKAFVQSIGGTIAVLIPLYVIYNPAEIPQFSTTVVFIWIVMALILAGAAILSFNRLKPETDMESAKVSDETFEEKPAKILSRLPLRLQSSELYALSAEDHYVRVHTSKGDDIILMRFSDAILETGDVEGLQVHRSWWVAKAAIDDVKAKGRSAEVTLKNTRKAPVSRNAVKTIRDMGWI